jgi:peroxiredoxin
MLFQPAIIALLLASALCVLALAASAPFALDVIRRWDIASGSERQLQLERRTYLFSTLLTFVLALQLAAVLLFVFNAEKMSGMFVGAMCAVGTLNVNAFGFPALNAKIAVFFLAAMWLAINHVDSRARDYPLVRIKYALLLLLAPLLVASGWVELQYFLGLKADVITSCCGSLFSEGSPTLAAEASALPPRPAMWLFYGSLGGAIAVAAWHGYGGGRSRAAAYALAAASALAFAATIAGILSFVSLYIYEHPNHHCPFLYPQARVWLSGLLALCTAVRRHGGGAGGRRGAALRAHRKPARHRAGFLAHSRRHRGQRLRLDRRDCHGDDLAVAIDFVGALMRSFLALILAMLLAACGGDRAPAKLNIGDIAPVFETIRADGTPAQFPAAWAGKPLVIRFWADWCKYCEGEMKDIEKVYQRLKPRGLDVIAINAGQDRKTVVEFMKKLGVSYPALMDENSAIAKRYGVVGLPTTYFVDAKGIVRAKLIGEADEASFERAALEALK